MAEPTEEGEGHRAGPMALVAFAICNFYVCLAACLAGWTLLPTVFHDWHPEVISSGSMSPGLRTGDLVLFEDSDGRHLGVGDVIIFHLPDRQEVTTHRIVSVDARHHTYRTQGDANPAWDSTPVSPDMIIGRGRLIIPLAGLPNLWVQQGQILLLLGWLVGSAVAFAVAIRGPRGRPPDPSAPIAPPGSGRGRRRRAQAALGLAGTTTVAVVLVVLLAPAAHAAFSTQATSQANSWVAAADFPPP